MFEELRLEPKELHILLGKKNDFSPLLPGTRLTNIEDTCRQVCIAAKLQPRVSFQLC